MALFKTIGSDLESKIKHFEVNSLPLDLSNKFDEGTSAHIYKLHLRGKISAVKAFKQQLPKKKILEAASKLRELEHENIVCFHGYSVRPAALLLEYCYVEIDGSIVHNLFQLLSIFNENEYFNFMERWKYLYQAIEGLSFLHQNQIVHRDFKPSNVLVTGCLLDIKVKLTDFDEMVSLKETTMATMSLFNLKGMTLNYVAPEIVNRSVRRPTWMTDIYAFAISTYEVFSDNLSAWKNVLPVMNDSILIEALRKQERPDLKDLFFNSFADTPVEIQKVTSSIISESWNSDADKRPTASLIASKFKSVIEREGESKLKVDFNVDESTKEKEKQDNNVVIIEHLPSIDVKLKHELDDIDDIFSGKDVVPHNEESLDHELHDIDDIFSGRDVVPHNEESLYHELYDTDESISGKDDAPHNEESLYHELYNTDESISGKDDVPHNEESLYHELYDTDESISGKDDVPHNEESLYHELHDTDESISGEDDVPHNEESLYHELYDTDESISGKDDVPHNEESLYHELYDTDESISGKDDVPHNEESLDHELHDTDESISGEDDVPHNEESTTAKNKSKRPLRKCIFCGCMRLKLTRHMMIRHPTEPRVANAMKLKKGQRTEAFKRLRWEGISLYNKEQIQNNPENPQLQGERSLRTSKEYVRCSVCNFFGSRKYFFSHKKHCSKKNDEPAFALPIMDEKLMQGNRLITDDFKSKIIGKLRMDKIGELCKKDEMIVMIGSKLFNKLKVKTEKSANVYRSVRSDMRILAKLYNAFSSVAGINILHGNFADMFRTENFDEVCVAIDQVTYDDVKKVVKPGLRSNIFYLLKKAGKYIQLHGYIKNNEKIAEDVTRFLRCFNASEDDLVCGARYVLEQNRQKKNRKPCNLPLEEDLKKLNKFMLNQMKNLLDEYHHWTSKSFIELRNIVCTRLTLVNGRRGGEIGRMLLEEWKEAEKDGWIDAQRLNEMSKADQEFVKALKVTFMAGKGNRHIVSVFIPEDCVEGLKKVSDPEVRSRAGILATNKFLFATQTSDIYLSGWHVLKDICKKIELQSPELINGTNNRHRLSTIFASLNLPKDVKEAFYKHMGHSEEINRNVYQTPIALMGIRTYGNHLLKIDQGEYSGNSSNKDAISTKPAKRKRMYFEKGDDELTGSDDDGNDGGEHENGKSPKETNRKRMYFEEGDDELTGSDDDGNDDDGNDDSEHENGKSPKETKRKRMSFEKGDDELTGSDDDGNDDGEHEKGKSPKENQRNRKSARWTAFLHSAFMEEFGAYVKRTKGYSAMPDGKQMEAFVKKYNCRFDKFVVRTKINNERAKHDKLVKQQLKESGMVSD